jgi:hypothetical protein
MALRVHDVTGGVIDFPTANVYHIDDDGALHLSEPNPYRGNQHPPAKNIPVGSLAAGQWIAVVKVPARSAGPFQ